MESIINPRITPAIGKERLIELDILRGFAILSILFVHMRLFFQSTLYWMDLAQQTSLVDRIADILVLIFAEGKFFPIFSFLFGLGLALQWEKAKEKGAKVFFLHVRRFLLLLIIGIIHALFFWTMDILVLWAILGFILLIFFRNARPKTLLVFAGIFLMLFFLYYSLMTGLVELGRLTPEGAEAIRIGFDQTIKFLEVSRLNADGIFARGSFAEVTAQRVSDIVTFNLSSAIVMGPVALGMMLLGLYAAKVKIFEKIEEKIGFIKRVCTWGLIIGLPSSVLYVLIKETARQSISIVPSFEGVIAYLFFTIGGPALSLFYMASIVLLIQNTQWQERLSILAPVGRMALTNYLMQSFISTTLSYGYGFALYGQIGVAEGLLLAILIAVIQVLLSRWWFSRFAFGPVEWLWRSLSYFKLQPIRKRTEINMVV